VYRTYAEVRESGLKTVPAPLINNLKVLQFILAPGSRYKRRGGNGYAIIDLFHVYPEKGLRPDIVAGILLAAFAIPERQENY
jgi:hypothetical protein